MSYIGSTPTTQSFIAGTDTFSGTGSQTAFTLSRPVNTVNDILVVVNNVDQEPSNYTVSGSTLTFSPAPSSGTNNIYVRYLTTTLQTIAPSPKTVGLPELSATGTPSASTYLRGDNTWSTVSTGTVAVSSGGTGQTSYTDGQLLIGNSTGNTLTKATLTAGSGITVTNGAGAITIAASGGGGGGNPQMSFASYPTTVFNSTGTPMANTGTGTFNWTCPAGVTKVMVSVVAGGGGSNGAEGHPSGGWGGTAVGIYTVAPATVYAITVGNGGAGSNPSGGSGGSSSFSTLATATGGTGTNPDAVSTNGIGSSGNIKNSKTTSYVSTHVGFLGNYAPVNVDTGTSSPVPWTVNTGSSPGAGGNVGAPAGGVSGIVLITWVG
jgi:hypothetical protein